MRWLFIITFLGCGFFDPGARRDIPATYAPSTDWAADFGLVSLNGEPFDHADFRDHVVLVVNVASRCGFTSQYDGLQALWERYQDQGLLVLGVPCNQFAGQEPGSAEEIASFCRMNFGVDFPLLEKQNVRGDDQSPLYEFLVDSPLARGSDVAWNFEKFLVGPDGRVLGRYRSNIEPDDAEFVQDIENALVALER